jgi:hypothetical protein
MLLFNFCHRPPVYFHSMGHPGSGPALVPGAGHAKTVVDGGYDHHSELILSCGDEPIRRHLGRDV